MPTTAFRASAAGSAPSPNSLSNGISFTFKNGFNAIPRPGRGSSAAARLIPALANFQSASYKSRESGKPGYYADYNFTVEHSLTANTLWRTSFHANYGIKLQVAQNFNQLDPKYFAIYGNLLTTPLSTVINNPLVIASGFRLPYASLPDEPPAAAGACALSRSTRASAVPRRPGTAPTMPWRPASRSASPRASG